MIWKSQSSQNNPRSYCVWASLKSQYLHSAPPYRSLALPQFLRAYTYFLPFYFDRNKAEKRGCPDRVTAALITCTIFWLSASLKRLINVGCEARGKHQAATAAEHPLPGTPLTSVRGPVEKACCQGSAWQIGIREPGNLRLGELKMSASVADLKCSYLYRIRFHGFLFSRSLAVCASRRCVRESTQERHCFCSQNFWGSTTDPLSSH